MPCWGNMYKRESEENTEKEWGSIRSVTCIRRFCRSRRSGVEGRKNRGYKSRWYSEARSQDNRVSRILARKESRMWEQKGMAGNHENTKRLKRYSEVEVTGNEWEQKLRSEKPCARELLTRTSGRR